MKHIFFLFSIFLSYQSFAQMTSDALLFSENHQTVNARSMALGNAMGALGADMSAANLNPAGIAVYRRMEIALGMGAYFDNTTTSFIGNSTRDRMSQFSFGNVGMVFAAKMRRKRNKWKSFNVGLTFNRIANYGRTFSYTGVSGGSRVQSFAENANGVAPQDLDPYEGWVAYNAYLMDSVGFLSYSPNGGISDNAAIQKYQSVQRTGGVNELGLTIGGNYNHKLYLAATVGVNFLNMKEDRFYQERADSIDFQAMDFTENRTIKGTGINLKIGMIYRINKIFRIGAAIHTPTAYRLVDSYNSGLYGRIVYDSAMIETDYPMETQEPYVLQHDLATPWVFIGSFGAVIAKKAFIGVDLEYTDYSWANFSLLQNERTAANNQFMSALNKRVQDQYQGVLKARIGAEVALGIARLRVGYQFQTSPYRISIDGVTDMRHDISAGVGVRWKHFFLDFAYVHTLRDFEYSPYVANTIQQVTGASQTGHAMLTVGASIFRTPREENRS